ncbi:MAG TPA: ATP-dependent exonuclease SbcCD, C subunit-like protein, partial [Desulfobacterales bacterium]|nr:ATP-dependent exonuclease SbcCD, C subunit-like protein [Desulfobacterales bacterium]
MQNMLLDFAASDELAGFRLQRLEIYNWGTFHNRVWVMNLNGENALLTGDIGSGKSTLVDAVTTLLVPPQRIAYNKAAGADSRERSLRSYVMGYYKTERSDSGHASKPVALRDHNSYSVILSVFGNSGYGQILTLAQVFWSRDLSGQPNRFYLIARQDMSITEHFADFGSDINLLRKRLRAAPKTDIYDSFPPYAADFRRRFGIDNDQALDLFHQTVSMKSVGNLTAFVRTHMLEAADTRPRIKALLNHFDDLTRAHEAVVKAKKQIDLLTPLAADCRQYREITARTGHWRYCRDGLQVHFALQKAELIGRRLDKLDQEKTRLEQRIRHLMDKRRQQLAERDQIKSNIADNGGDRLARIKIEIQNHTREKGRRRERAERYQLLSRRAALKDILNVDDFHDNLARIESLKEGLDQREAELQNEHTEKSVRLEELKRQYQGLRQEIESLKKRRSNIDSRQIRIRAELCAALGLDEGDMPFAGELIKVGDDEEAWEGAAERLLHNFGLSLLVPESAYKAVAAYVDGTHLRGRLVYFRVKAAVSGSDIDLHPQSLCHKLVIKPDCGFYGWLERELARRFDYACTESLAQFQRERRAVTRAGQIKSGGRRHEKDDRYKLTDRGRYILGWTNEQKIAALNREAGALADKTGIIEAKISKLQGQLHELS